MTYNLLEERWIPVLKLDGSCSRVGIKEALAKAGEIRQFVASNPMDRFALLRFMLAVLYWCKGNPPPDAWKLCQFSIPTEWLEKLDQEREYFNLLGDGKRFMQYKLTGAKETLLPVTYLIHEVPTGININHFLHAHDEVDGLCPACCANGILRLPAFATSAGRGKPPGINSKPPAYILPVGTTLLHTLLLNWSPHTNLGHPAWISPAKLPPSTGSVPLLYGLTWVPRRIWLEPVGTSTATCALCGQKGQLIRQMVFAAIGSTKQDEDSPAREWSDPHVLYTAGKGTGRISLHAADALGSSDAAAGQWYRIYSAIRCRPGMEHAIGLWLVGFSTVQNDKYLEANEMMFPIPSPSRDEGEHAAIAEVWQKACFKITGQVKQALGGSSSRKGVNGPAVLANVKPEIENRIFTQLHTLCGAETGAWESTAAEAYAPLMKAVAEVLAPGATVSAVQRCQQISRLAPSAQPVTKREMKVKRISGGGS